LIVPSKKFVCPVQKICTKNSNKKTTAKGGEKVNKVMEALETLENGGTVKNVYAYGVGIDTHSKFIQVCVLLHHANEIKQYEDEFTTAWDDLNKAREWIKFIIKKYSNPAKTESLFTDKFRSLHNAFILFEIACA
jgi:hypothetical protein